MAAKVRGNILQLFASVLAGSGLAPKQAELVKDVIKRRTGKDVSQLSEQDFYSCDIEQEIEVELSKLRGAISMRGLMRLAGTKVYPDYVIPTMQADNKLPSGLVVPGNPTPLLKFEADGFLYFHEGVQPRKFIELKQKRIVVDAKSPHNRQFMEGVFEGICNLTVGKRKSVISSTEDFIFTIEW